MSPTSLARIVEQNHAQLASALVDQLTHSRAPHYRAIGVDRLSRRSAELVRSLIAALQQGPAPFVQHMVTVTRERLREGVELRELQLALSRLEQQAWKVVVARTPPELHADLLACLTTVIGLAKDRVAQVVVEDRQREALSALSRGTDAAPETEVHDD